MNVHKIKNSIFHLYSLNEKEVDILLDRHLLKQQIISHFPAPIIIHAPPGAGAFSFAKTCLAIAGFETPTIMDALDLPSSAYGNIRQSLYTKSRPIAYIFKNGHSPEVIPFHIPTIQLTHSPMTDNLQDHPSTLHISLSPVSESQMQKLFFLYTGDTSTTMSFLWKSTYGSFHGLSQAVCLYRTNIKAFQSFINEFSNRTILCPLLSENGPWNISDSTIAHIRTLYSIRPDMPSSELMCKTWPQYISTAWRIILPRYSAFAKSGILRDMPEELKCWYMLNQFQRIPSKGIAPEHAMRVISQDIKLESMHDVALYSAHSYQMTRDEIDCMFRRIHNAYYTKLRSNKNKITAKTKKESIETARLEMFRETCSWNDKLFRKWTQYTAGFARV